MREYAINNLQDRGHLESSNTISITFSAPLVINHRRCANSAPNLPHETRKTCVYWDSASIPYEVVFWLGLDFNLNKLQRDQTFL
jgi:hypothetical protein